MTDRDAVVLLPGSLCDERVFEPQRRDLERQYDVVVGDLTRADSIETMAHDVLAAAPPRFALFGLSLGAIVAAEIHQQATERITGLALLDTNLAPPDEAQLERRSEWADMAATGHFLDIARDLVPVSTVYPDRLGDLVIDMARRVGVDAFRRQNTALGPRPDRRPWLAQVDVPTLVGCGREDAVCPVSVHEDLAARAPRSELAVIAGAGHLSTLDRPKAVSSLLADWLGAIYRPGTKPDAGHRPRTAGTTASEQDAEEGANR